MAQIRIIGGLPYVTATVRLNSRSKTFSYVLLDTGSATCIFKTDHLLDMGLTFEPGDPIRNIIGIGGIDPVVEKEIESIQIDDMIVSHYKVEVGVLDFNFPLDGIIGTDFLQAVKAQIDFDRLEITRSAKI